MRRFKPREQPAMVRRSLLSLRKLLHSHLSYWCPATGDWAYGRKVVLQLWNRRGDGRGKLNESDFQSKHTNNKAMEQTDLRTRRRSPLLCSSSLSRRDAGLKMLCVMLSNVSGTRTKQPETRSMNPSWASLLSRNPFDPPWLTAPCFG